MQAAERTAPRGHRPHPRTAKTSDIQHNLDSAATPPAEGCRSHGTPGSGEEEDDDHVHPRHPDTDAQRKINAKRTQGQNGKPQLQGADIIAGANITNFRTSWP